MRFDISENPGASNSILLWPTMKKGGFQFSSRTNISPISLRCPQSFPRFLLSDLQDILLSKKSCWVMAEDVEVSDGRDGIWGVFAQMFLQGWWIIRVAFLQANCIHLSAQSHSILDVVIYDKVEFFVCEAVTLCKKYYMNLCIKYSFCCC